MSLLSTGVFGTSKKESEKRVPIHPGQLLWIKEDIRKHLFFEKGYGQPFGYDDNYFVKNSGGILSRHELFNRDLIILPKPVQGDFDEMKQEGIIWGWPHCVQQSEITQSAIDKKLTLIAWESMHKWTKGGDWIFHIFQKNNEMAGYAAVLHALGLAGKDGNYGPHLKAVVISFGSVSRGAITALRAVGIHDILVLTHRHSTLVADQMSGIEYIHYEEHGDDDLIAVSPSGKEEPIMNVFHNADIIVNGILQDTDHPTMFIKKGEVDYLKPGCLIVDISCDLGMGFYFARPTSFKNPMFMEGNVNYYAVDHTPSYLWDSASWEISMSILPYLPMVMKGEESWLANDTVNRSIEILNGKIKNEKILSFQKRKEEYPYPAMA